MEDAELRILIVDGDAAARRALFRACGGDSCARVVAECADGDAAVKHIGALAPDAVFIDPETSGRGLEALQSLDRDDVPMIVFVSANRERAVLAFELGAADYLLKPIDAVRVRATLDRLCASRAQRLQVRHFARLLETFRGLAAADPTGSMAAAGESNRYARRLAVRTDGRVFFVPASQIDYLEACRNYVCVHAGGQKHLVRGTLAKLARTLDPSIFARIHRSTIVNTTRVRELQPSDAGDYVVTLADGTRLRMSRRYRGALEDPSGA